MYIDLCAVVDVGAVHVAAAAALVAVLALRAHLRGEVVVLTCGK